MTSQIAQKIVEVVKVMEREGDIDSKTADFLIPRNAKPSRFYTLPKTHKPRDPELGRGVDPGGMRGIYPPNI